MAPNISVPRPSIVRTVRPGCAAKTLRTRNISTPCWGRRWLRPATTKYCRCRRNSSRRRMAPQNRIAKKAPARRWLAARAKDYARLDPIYLGDDLFSRQPLCAAVLAAGAHFIFVCKPTSHPLIGEYIARAELAWRADT